MARTRRALRRGAPAALAAAVLLTVGRGSAAADVEVLSAELVARLTPVTQQPLALASSGDPTRFLAGDAEWEEAGPPLLVDGTGTGTRDFVVFLFVDARTERRALVVHEWGSAPEGFGRAVFYVILEPDGDVVEWAGTHQLPSPIRPPESTPAPPGP